MIPPFYLLFGFIYYPAETVIHLFMYAFLIFIPDEIWNIVNGSFKVLAGLPESFAHFTRLLPPLETESYLFIRHRQRPYVFNIR